jgi:hypothetical protein
MVCLTGILLLMMEAYPAVADTLQDTATYTNTPTNTSTPTNTPTPTPTPIHADLYEPNDSFETATSISAPGSLDECTFWGGNIDYYVFWGKVGRTYTVYTDVDEGVDSNMRLFGPNKSSQLIDENDDASGDDLGSLIEFKAPVEGYYYVELTYVGVIPPAGTDRRNVDTHLYPHQDSQGDL